MCENLKSTFLCDQWSDLVHILQFDSTDEYFETVEYEGHAPLGSRDISENHPVNGIFTVSTRWISHNFFRIWCESPTLSELISVSSGRIDFKIVLNQSYGCILPGKNCFGTVPSPQDVDKKFGKKSWTLFPKSPTTSLQRERC